MEQYGSNRLQGPQLSSLVCRLYAESIHTTPNMTMTLTPRRTRCIASTYMHDESVMRTFFWFLCMCLDQETMNSWEVEWKAWREPRRKEGCEQRRKEVKKELRRRKRQWKEFKVIAHSVFPFSVLVYIQTRDFNGLWVCMATSFYYFNIVSEKSGVFPSVWQGGQFKILRNPWASATNAKERKPVGEANFI